MHAIARMSDISCKTSSSAALRVAQTQTAIPPTNKIAQKKQLFPVDVPKHFYPLLRVLQTLRMSGVFIAPSLLVSQRLRRHAINIYRRLNIHSLEEYCSLAVQAGLIHLHGGSELGPSTQIELDVAWWNWMPPHPTQFIN